MFSKVPVFSHKVDLPVSQCAKAVNYHTFQFSSGKQVSLHPTGTTSYIDNVPCSSFKFANGYPYCQGVAVNLGTDVHRQAVITEEIEFVTIHVIIREKLSNGDLLIMDTGTEVPAEQLEA